MYEEKETWTHTHTRHINEKMLGSDIGNMFDAVHYAQQSGGLKAWVVYVYLCGTIGTPRETESLKLIILCTVFSHLMNHEECFIHHSVCSFPARTQGVQIPT